MNGTVVKNQLIFDFASGILGPAKSLFASTYLQLNSNAYKINSTFENMLGENLMDNENINPKNLKYTDCINGANTNKSASSLKDPVTSFFGNLNNLNWKQVYKGFKEYTASIDDMDELMQYLTQFKSSNVIAVNKTQAFVAEHPHFNFV